MYIHMFICIYMYVESIHYSAFSKRVTHKNVKNENCEMKSTVGQTDRLTDRQKNNIFLLVCVDLDMLLLWLI